MTNPAQRHIPCAHRSIDASLGILNNETVALATSGFLMWAKHVNTMRPPAAPKVNVNFAVLTFNQIQDSTERQRFNAMPTTFHLQPDEVDALRALAGRLLTQAPEFQGFLSEMQSDESAMTAPAVDVKASSGDVPH